MHEIECTPTAHCNNVCVWKGDILLRCPYDIWCFLAVMRLPYEIKKSRGSGVGGEEVIQRHASSGGGVDGEYMLRRYESSWLCMKFALLGIAYESSCFLLHNLLMRVHAFGTASRFIYEISCFLVLMRRFHAFRPYWDFLVRLDSF